MYTVVGGASSLWWVGFECCTEGLYYHSLLFIPHLHVHAHKREMAALASTGKSVLYAVSTDLLSSSWRPRRTEEERIIEQEHVHSTSGILLRALSFTLILCTTTAVDLVQRTAVLAASLSSGSNHLVTMESARSAIHVHNLYNSPSHSPPRGFTVQYLEATHPVRDQLALFSGSFTNWRLGLACTKSMD